MFGVMIDNLEKSYHLNSYFEIRYLYTDLGYFLLNSYDFWATVCKTIRLMLSDRWGLSVLSCL